MIGSSPPHPPWGLGPLPGHHQVPGAHPPSAPYTQGHTCSPLRPAHTQASSHSQAQPYANSQQDTKHRASHPYACPVSCPCVYTCSHKGMHTTLAPTCWAKSPPVPRAAPPYPLPFPGPMQEGLRGYHIRWAQDREQLLIHRHQPCNTSLLLLGEQGEVEMEVRGIE